MREGQTASSHAPADVVGIVKAGRRHVEGQHCVLDEPLLVGGLGAAVFLHRALARPAQDGVADVRVVRTCERLVEERERAHHAHGLLVALTGVEARRLARQPAGRSPALFVVRVLGAERRLVLLVEVLGHRVSHLQHALVCQRRHHNCRASNTQEL